MSTAVKIWLSLLLMLAAVYGTYTIARTLNRPHAEVADDTSAVMSTPAPRPLDDFTFTDTSGKTFALKDLQGQVWVASFFFADCSSFCKQMNQRIAGLQNQLAKQGVKIVSITVDPTNDTPERLAEYAQQFAADPQEWVFLTGPFEDSRDLGQGVFKVSVLGRDHSDRLILVDRDGNVRGRYSSLDDAQFEAFQKKVREVVAEQAPGKTEQASPGEAEQASPGKTEQASPGKAEQASPGKAEQASKEPS